jgi:sodium-dependent phosphate transporter
VHAAARRSPAAACRRLQAVAGDQLIAALPPHDLPPFATSRSLQVLSAICVSFAHGANDVANACGPLAGIWATYQAGEFVAETETPVWVLIIGAVGLVIGLATYGYNIIRALGVRMAAMTPSRGFSAELATSLVVSVASAYGMPISTTHTITGAVVGVGLMEGRAGVNWWQFSRVFAAWVFTLIFTGAFAAALFAQGVYAPSLG